MTTSPATPSKRSNLNMGILNVKGDLGSYGLQAAFALLVNCMYVYCRNRAEPDAMIQTQVMVNAIRFSNNLFRASKIDRCKPCAVARSVRSKDGKKRGKIKMVQAK